MADEQPCHFIPLLLTGIVQRSVAILVLMAHHDIHPTTLPLPPLPGNPRWSYPQPVAGEQLPSVQGLKLCEVELPPVGPESWCRRLEVALSIYH